jgi:hypothetical protein
LNETLLFMGGTGGRRPDAGALMAALPALTKNLALEGLRARIAATRWPEKETVADQSQGVQLETIQGARALLGEGIRLARVRGEAERPAAIHHQD